MRGLNPLRTKVLITVDEVLFHAPTEGNADPRLILNSIIVAERRLVKPMLGGALYQALIDKKNILVTDENKEELQGKLNEGRGDDREIIELVKGDYYNTDEYLSELQLTLWTDYLHKIVAECVYYAALPTNRARFGAQGVNVNNPATISSTSNTASVELKDLKHLMDSSLLNRISPLMEDMHQYLCSSSFAGYTKDCGCSSDGVAYKSKSSIILGMYDDDDDFNYEERRSRRRW